MPALTLPTFTRAEVEAHNSETDCYVTIDDAIYDITDFVESHPGGPELVMEYAGKDIKDILRDETSHTHSESAYEILEETLVGFVSDKATVNGSAKAPNGTANGVNGDASAKPTVHPRTGMSCEEDLSKETDYNSDYKKHKFLDLGRPLFPQLWYGGFTKEFYLDQVHRPRHYKGGASAPLFGNFLEPLSKTAWWVVPMIWCPAVSYGLYLANPGYSNVFEQALYFLVGFGLWSLIEYVLHRFLFHLDEYLPDNRVGLTAHFLLHGIHHYLPMDKYRLVMPPALFAVLASPFWKLAHTLFPNWDTATTIYCGGVFGYICYDLTHYFLHHKNLPLWYKELKKYHLAHHFLDYELGFGVSSKFWDQVFGTELQTSIKTK